tara:strand:+ start:898 stop:1488 length:591 start_codon:yes stop_codon:yes gene_type:complete
MTTRKPYQGAIFVSKPRCASTAIFEHIYEWDDNTDGAKPLYHCTAFDMLSRVGVPYWISIPSFAIVRSPQSLVESWFMHHKHGSRPSQDVKSQYPDTIEEWIDGGFCTHWDSSWTSSGQLANPLPQKQWVDHLDKQLVTMVLRLEDLDWTELNNFGIDMSGLPIRNIAPNLSSPLSKSAVQKIEEYFAADYERFGY